MNSDGSGYGSGGSARQRGSGPSSLWRSSFGSAAALHSAGCPRAFLLSALFTLVACEHTYIELNPDAPDDAEMDAAPLPSVCGDGVTDPGEECDDGNRLDNDVCRWDCTIGVGPGPGPADPLARSYRAEGPSIELPAPSRLPGGLGMGGEQVRMPFSTGGGFHMGTWPSPPLPDGTPAALSVRFLALDGSIARDDVVIGLASGWTMPSWAQAARGTELLALFQARDHGIFGTRVTADLGMISAPAFAETSPTAGFPAVAGTADGYVMAWYDGTSVYPCSHVDADPSRVFIRRLAPDGTPLGGAEPMVLEEPDAARTAPALATGDDLSVGLVWWRASPTAGVACTLRVGVADGELSMVADGGAIGPGRGGRVVFEDGAYRVAWLNSDEERRQIGFGAFGSDAGLLGPPVLHDLPVEILVGEVELSAGDHELVAVIGSYTAAAGQHLLFMVTDLLGRLVAPPASVDPTCESATANCWPGPFNVVRSGEGFLIMYFATTDPAGPAPVTEMRMMRLVPAG
ncbi:MAG: hypothetical protein HY905_17330 [Deltaproteobacteria bacterium]|nr:hypothetical protein [Deltaproteobacteria bacterium]